MHERDTEPGHAAAKPAKVRCFFALPMSDARLAELLALGDALRTRGVGPAGKLRWLGAAQLHVTLKFLGGVPESVVPALCAQLAQHAANTPALSARIAQITGFPSPRRARVLVLRLSEAGAHMQALAERLETDGEAIGVPRERRTFKPHITLARSRVPTDVSAFASAPLPGAEIAFDEVRLYASKLSRAGSEYSVLASCKLGGPAQTSTL